MAETLTKDSFEELNKKLQALKAKRPVISKTIEEARLAGDLRENSAYHEAKKEQSLNESVIRDLEERLQGARIISEKDMVKDQVTVGTSVKLIDVATGRKSEYKIVSELEADIFENKISPSSPLGGALIGGKVGEIVEFEAPVGLKKFRIEEIK